MLKDIDTDRRVLAASGSLFVALDKKERWQVEQRWRQAFARSVREKTGSWTYGGFDWEAFSSGLVRCLKGARALEAYSHVVAPEFFVTPHYPDEMAFRCQGGRLPSYTEFQIDRYVFDPECTWTMAFTHEADCGPYYCERQWIPGDPDR